MSKIRITVIGCNNMGAKHIKVLQDNFGSEIEIAGILNSSPESSKRKAAELNVPYFDNIDEINKQTTDAVIVSAPGRVHAEIAEKILKRGVPCLVEKPLAVTSAECNRLIAAAEKSKTLLLVGHTENYNPAVLALKQNLKKPLQSIKALRTSLNADNTTGISAVQELMIHDLAIVYSLLGAEPSSVSIGKSSNYSWENHAVVDMTYPSGCKIRLEALRDNVPVKRVMDLEDIEGNRFQINFLERSLKINDRLICEGGNSLLEEHRNFIACVKGLEKPLVNGWEGKNILELCLKAEAKIPIVEMMKRKIKDNFTKKI